MSSIENNFQIMRDRIRRAERVSGRTEGSTALMAVTKTQSSETIDAALACGQRLFGENRVQEAILHWSEKKALYPDLKLHLIGPLQTNKVPEAVELFDCIETLDREKLALALASEFSKTGKACGCLIQVDTGDEAQKAGIGPRDLPDFLGFSRNECGLRIDGLMCIPPADEPAALHFAFLKTLARRYGLETLSMGMSGDFEKAVALGASHIRLGSALFGNRV